MKRSSSIFLILLVSALGVIACSSPVEPDFTSNELTEEVILQSNAECPERCLLQNGECEVGCS